MKKYTKDSLLMAAMVAVLTGSGFLSAGYAMMEHSAFLPGSTLNGMDISGLSPEQAEELVLEQERAHTHPVSLVLQCEGETLLLNDENTGRSSNAETLIHDYLFNLYEGSAGEKYDTLLAFRKNVIVEYAFEYDIETLRKTIGDFAARFERPAKDAALEVDEGGALLYLPGEQGQYLDVGEASETVHKLLQSQTEGELELRLKQQEPLVTEEELRQQVSQIGYCSTEIAQPEHYHNIDAIAKQINGTVIQPGELLSLNELTGPRDAQAGYIRAATDAPDELDGCSAGVSQAAGTLYNAALLADMEIVERNAQSVPTEYLQPGLDAIIDNATSKDLIIKNTSELPAYVFMSREDNKLEAGIYGMLDGYSVKVETEVQEWLPPGEPEYIYDESLDENERVLECEAREGAIVVVSRDYYNDEDGSLSDSRRVSTDSYQPVKARYRVGDISLSSK